MNEMKNASFIGENENPAEISNEEWGKILPHEIYHIAREKRTERPGSGKYYQHNDVDTYYCAVCGNSLFICDGKFNSSCGWPSFFEPITADSLIYIPDNSFGMWRTEGNAGNAIPILGTCLKMDPNQPVCDIV